MIETTPDDLRAALGINRWVADVQVASPFDSLESLMTTAHSAAIALTPDEIDEAISHHPRIGEKPRGEGVAQSFSRREQGTEQGAEGAAEQSPEGGAHGDAVTTTAIAAGNAAYEAKFGRIFIIRAAGRSRAEILTELTRRLELDPAAEITIVGEQLRDIALLRLEALAGRTD